MSVAKRSNDVQQCGWAVIFDVDGTMVDNANYHEQAWIELGKKYDLGITNEFYREHIHSRSNDKNVRLLFDQDISSEMIDKIGNEKETFYRRIYQPIIKEIAGLTDLLKALYQKHIPCAAASNSPKANVDMVLDELNIRKYFKVTIDRAQVSTGKPNPEVLLKAAAKLGLEPQKCVLFEDSLSGFKAAQRAKMPYIVITEGADKNDLKYATSAQAIHKDFTTINPAGLEELVT